MKNFNTIKVCSNCSEEHFEVELLQCEECFESFEDNDEAEEHWKKEHSTEVEEEE